VDQVHSLRKIPARPCLANLGMLFQEELQLKDMLCVNGTSSASFASNFVQ
jgi:hypothetical protein